MTAEWGRAFVAKLKADRPLGHSPSGLAWGTGTVARLRRVAGSWEPFGRAGFWERAQWRLRRRYRPQARVASHARAVGAKSPISSLRPASRRQGRTAGGPTKANSHSVNIRRFGAGAHRIAPGLPHPRTDLLSKVGTGPPAGSGLARSGLRDQDAADDVHGGVGGLNVAADDLGRAVDGEVRAAAGHRDGAALQRLVVTGEHVRAEP